MTSVLIKNLELSNFNFLSCHLLFITAFAEKKKTQKVAFVVPWQEH